MAHASPYELGAYLRRNSDGYSTTFHRLGVLDEPSQQVIDSIVRRSRDQEPGIWKRLQKLGQYDYYRMSFSGPRWTPNEA